MTQKIAKLIIENPDLPVIAMVDGEICEDDSHMWLGSFSNALITEVGLVGERYYDDRDDFKDAYYDKHMEELDKRFNYRLDMLLADDEESKATAAKLDAYLNEVADTYMIKAIAVYVREPNMSIFKEAL